MISRLIILFFVLQAAPATGQGTLIDRAGTVSFFSEAPLENIEAVNKKAVGAMDLSNGNIAVTMNMTDFQFAKSLMQEHFNENYMESDRFPKATFKGLIDDFDQNQFDRVGHIQSEVTGEITIHGVTKQLKAQVTFQTSDNIIAVNTSFLIKVADFDIDIPKVVFYNIAEEVEVTADFVFDKP